MKRKSTRTPPARYADRDRLLAAVREWCRVRLEGGASPWLRVVAADLHQICAVRSPEDDEARDVYLRLRVALHEAEDLIGRAPPAPPSYYATELRRLVSTTKAGRAWPPRGPDADMTARALLIDHVDLVRRRHPATVRELAILSLLAGNGRDWVTRQIKRARETSVTSHRPTVLEVVRAEEKAVRQARQRLK